MVIPWYGAVLPTAVAAWVMSKDSFAPSSSFSARTVTVCAVFQLPELPWVNVSVLWFPVVPASVSTSTAVASPFVTVIVTSAVGSVSRTTV